MPMAAAASATRVGLLLSRLQNLCVKVLNALGTSNNDKDVSLRASPLCHRRSQLASLGGLLGYGAVTADPGIAIRMAPVCHSERGRVPASAACSTVEDSRHAHRVLRSRRQFT